MKLRPPYMLYKGVICEVVVRLEDGWHNTLRNPTEKERPKIERFVDRYIAKYGAPPLGGGPVPGVGDVTFGLPPDN